LYNAKAHKVAEKAGTSAADWLRTPGNQDILGVDLHIATKQADPTDQLLELVQLTPPEITKATLRDVFPDGSYTLLLEGNWFGNKKISVWRECELNGAIVRQRLKVTPTGEAGYRNAKGDPGYMNATDGKSALIALVPAKPPKGLPNGVVVLDNGVGLAVIDEP